MMTSSETFRRWARFAAAIKNLRKDFPEFSREIDRTVYEIGQKIEACAEPDCECRISFEEFHSRMNRRIEEELREEKR